MCKRIVITILAAIMLVSCQTRVDKYLDFLYASMPLPDSLVHSEDYWRANIEKTLQVRDRMAWNIPEREFLHFVLPLRVNNEDLDDFRILYADTLCNRGDGMSLAEAAIEINHWCHEQATYKPSDSRTLGPVAIINSGLGRCGEESVLAVAALRAAGIPARQVYTPRWAHTDDNHAWVEVWVDGAWHFMGACEPEPVLDLAWFNAPVSRAMLLHTKVFGNNYEGPEDVINRTAAYTEINVIKSYIPTRRTIVKVVDGQGAPVEGANIEFKIYNYAEFYTVAKYKTDAAGEAGLDTGLGDVVVWASKDDKFGISVVHEERGEVVLDHTFGEECSFMLDIVPPIEKPLPDNSTPEQKARNAARLAEEDAIRESHPHPRVADPGIFLTEKDLIDVTPDVIDDVVFYTKHSDKNVICPRVEREFLMPIRGEIKSSGIAQRLHTPADAVQWVKDSIFVDGTRNPQVLRIPPVAVWRSRLSDEKSRDIFFVALCRALGWPSRLNPVNGVPQYMEGEAWVDVNFSSGVQQVAPEGILKLEYNPAGKPVKEPRYSTHFSISKIEDGSVKLCEFDEMAPLQEQYVLTEGYYMLVSGMRMADGSVQTQVNMFNVDADSTKVVPLVLRDSNDKPQVIGNMDAEKLFLPEGADTEASILSATGRGYFLLCVTGTKDEQSVHATRQLESCAETLNSWGRPIVILGGIRPAGLKNVTYGTDVDGEVAEMLREGVNSDKNRLPVIALCDSFGRIIFFSEGYNTSLGQRVTELINKIAE